MRQKNNNKNKTTKHTIEFSNNTRFRATLLLYSIAEAAVKLHVRCPRAGVLVMLLTYSTRSISAPKLARFSTNSG